MVESSTADASRTNEKDQVEEHGYGDDSDCTCGRNFATVRGLREHLTKWRFADAEKAPCTR